MPQVVRTCATLTIPSFPGCSATTRPSCHCNGATESPLNTDGRLFDVFHLCQTSWCNRCTSCHLLSRFDRIVSNGSSGLSAEAGHRGREFNTASICANTVLNSSKVRGCSPTTRLRWDLNDLTPGSHNPPIWGADEGLKCHLRVQLPAAACNNKYCNIRNLTCKCFR